ncbi:phosphotyrosyl phosphatase activator [Mytilinidion resinicola]|uniref:Serine/threonine-protein phosphatase 2A activator n=1 Tax=Mytilinidion resinicola TaxID=574789 RepID=A0A6A6Y817_9PEZI|nr:phosphotyrosyl phosphatase activator [Mytilinidion resinicola]KAF2804698.1 phosphotyrosyl phosphatase activator [Mytilinidion resinicola]
MADTRIPHQPLKLLDNKTEHKFALPAKCIHDGEDVSFFLTTKAYSDIMTFLFQLNASMFPRKATQEDSVSQTVEAWKLNDPRVPLSPITLKLSQLLEKLASFIDEVPPDTGPRRFGNVSFRKWYELVKERLPALMDEYLPAEILALGGGDSEGTSAKTELEAYLYGSFGSSQRLDYGTGHELSFLAFLGCLWKLGAFPRTESGVEERGIVLGVIEPYLQLVRRLILTYTLEPAGSHGVWGLDDHSFLPYIFGSAQLSPAIRAPADIPAEGSLPNAPNPPDVAKADVVGRERKTNMYFNAIGFIYDVKRGPFWEHSPILFDISGVKAGWAKINKGMLKMYNAEVLSKFPVVQHFPFGSLFAWEKDPAALAINASVHTTSQPTRQTTVTQSRSAPLRDAMQEGMRAPWAGAPTWSTAGTAAPWATTRAQLPVPDGPNQPTRAPWVSATAVPPPASGNATAAPWARSGRKPPRKPPA